MSNRRFPIPTLPQPVAVPSLEEEVQRLLQRFTNLETIVERKADNDKLKSAIRMSPEAILLEAKDVGVLGTFTVADIIQEQNGTTDGAVPLAITQIRGDVVRTGTIISNNWGASAGTAINLNTGTIIIGGSENPSLIFDDGDLTISGTLTAASVILTGDPDNPGISAEDLVAAALSGSGGGITETQLRTILAEGVGNIIAGNTGDYGLIINNSSLIAGHNLANLAGLGAAYTGDLRTGLMLNANGIAMGYNRKSDGAWVNSVAINSAGNASFSGAVFATSGTFVGTVSAGAIITGSVTVDGVSLSTIRSNAASGAALNSSLLAGGSAILTGVIQPTDTGGIRTGTITWNSSTGALTGGTGVAITEWGLVGASAGSATFSINAVTGAATFAGALSAATGTFAGSLSAASGTFSGNLNSTGYIKATGTFFDIDATAAIHGSPNTSGATGVLGRSTAGFGVDGRSSSGTGVIGTSASSTGVRGLGEIGGWFSGTLGLRTQANSASGVALQISQGYITRDFSTTGRITVYEQDSPYTPVGTYLYRFHL